MTTLVYCPTPHTSMSVKPRSVLSLLALKNSFNKFHLCLSRYPHFCLTQELKYLMLF